MYVRNITQAREWIPIEGSVNFLINYMSSLS